MNYTGLLQKVKAGKTAADLCAFPPQSVSGSAAISGSIIDRLGANSAFLSNLRAAVTGSPTAGKIKLVVQHGDESDLSDISTGFTFATTVAGVDGVSDVATVETVADSGGSLNDTYFLLSTPTVDYYVWVNVNSAGTDPEVHGKTGIEIAVATGATDEVVAAAIQVAVDALEVFTATVSTNTVTITNTATGAVTAIADSVTPVTSFTFATTVAGVDGVAEVGTVQLVADAAGSLNDTYFEFSSPSTDYYVWYNINAGGTDPAVASKIGIEVAGATGATADTLAAATQVAINAVSGLTAGVSTDTVTITNDAEGAATNVADSSGAATGFTFATTVQGVDEVAEVATVIATADTAGSLNNKYFLMSSPTVDYYVWMNVASAGTDPELSGKTGIEVAFASGATNEVVAAAIQAAIDAVGAFGATVSTATVTITNAVAGVADNIADSVTAVTGFTFDDATPGVDEVAEVSTVLAVADDDGSLNDLYFLLSSPYVDYYVWFNVNSEGTDPALAGKTGVEIAIATDAANTVVATAIETALDALDAFSASTSTATVTITNDYAGAATNVSDSDAGVYATLETALDVSTAAGSEDYFILLGSAKRYIRIVLTPTFTGGSAPAFIGAASMVLGDLSVLPKYDDDDNAPTVYGE